MRMAESPLPLILPELSRPFVVGTCSDMTSVLEQNANLQLLQNFMPTYHNEAEGKN